MRINAKDRVHADIQSSAILSVIRAPYTMAVRTHAPARGTLDLGIPAATRTTRMFPGRATVDREFHDICRIKGVVLVERQGCLTSAPVSPLSYILV